MYNDVNSQYFSAEQIKAGQMQKLLDFLMSSAYADGSNYYNDIHVRPEDCGAFVVEWVQVPWDGRFGGHFVYVDEDQVVMVEKHFPDGHYEYFTNEEEYTERLEEWLKENPGWVRTSYGTWTNEIENKKFQETLEKMSNKAEPHYENGVPQGE